MGIITVPPFRVRTWGGWEDATTPDLNATGEYLFCVGSLHILDGSASKTISAAGGGSLIWSTTGNTFADGSSVARLGIQDVAATGFQDGTFDVYKEFVGGVDTLPAAGEVLQSTMSSGSKTLSQGQDIAIGMEFTTRAGSDVIRVERVQQVSLPPLGTLNIGRPYATVNVGSPDKTQSPPQFLIVFDDGTLGFIQTAPLLYQVATSRTLLNYASGSSPDEYVLGFTPRIPFQASHFEFDLSNVASADTFELNLYEDPFGTPSVIGGPLTPDPDFVEAQVVTFPVPGGLFTFVPGAVYGLGVKATAAGLITLGYLDTKAASDPIAVLLKSVQFLGDLTIGGRTDATGAFTSLGEDALPFFALDVCGLDDGGGGSPSPGSPSPAGGLGSFGFVG